MAPNLRSTLTSFLRKVSTSFVVLVIVLSSIPSITASAMYTDMPAGAWYEETVTLLTTHQNKIINGYPDGAFRPNESIRFDQFITMIMKAMGHTLTPGTDYWAQPYIDKGISLGIIVKASMTKYTNVITREEMAPIIIRSIGLLDASQTYTYSGTIDTLFYDGNKIPDVFRKDVIKCAEIGIINGFNDGTFRGKEILTRAQAATVLIRMLYPEKRIETVTIGDNPIPLGGNSITYYGAKSDANYYNSADGNYYKDSGFKTLATDNRKAFQAAFNKGRNIHIPQGNYYISDTVEISKGIEITSDHATIVTGSSSELKYLFKITGMNTIISGLEVKTTLDRKPLLNNSVQGGLGSNVYAFVVQISNVTIEDCSTYNVCRGVHANKTRDEIKNLKIVRCNFYNATMPIFLMYTDGILIDQCYLQCNASGLPNGFHCLYFGTNTFNAVITNTDMQFDSVNNGGIIQFFSDKFDKVTISNIEISQCNMVTKGNHLVILGEVQDVVFDDITFRKINPDLGKVSESGKLIFAHDHVYDVIIKNSLIDMDDAANIINGTGNHYGNISLSHNKITAKLEKGTNLITTVMSASVNDNEILLDDDSEGLFFGFQGKGTIDFKSNTINTNATYILLGSGSSRAEGVLNMTGNVFDLNNQKNGFAFYNNTSKMRIYAEENTLTDFNALAQNSVNTVDINNIFRQ